MIVEGSGSEHSVLPGPATVEERAESLLKEGLSVSDVSKKVCDLNPWPLLTACPKANEDFAR